MERLEIVMLDEQGLDDQARQNRQSVVSLQTHATMQSMQSRSTLESILDLYEVNEVHEFFPEPNVTLSRNPTPVCFPGRMSNTFFFSSARADKTRVKELVKHDASLREWMRPIQNMKSDSFHAISIKCFNGYGNRKYNGYPWLQYEAAEVSDEI